jgi:hypothetical protein
MEVAAATSPVSDGKVYTPLSHCDTNKASVGTASSYELQTHTQFGHPFQVTRRSGWPVPLNRSRMQTGWFENPGQSEGSAIVMINVLY